MDEKSLREEMTRKGIDLLEKTYDMDPGSDKHSKIIDDVVRLSKACTEDYKVECEMYYENLKVEEETKRNEEEIKIKKLQIDLETMKHNRVKADNILIMSVLGGLTVVGFGWEFTGGHIVPGKVAQLVSYIPKFAKVW